MTASPTARDERTRLESIAEHSTYGAGANAATVAYSARVFGRLFRGERCLELGPAEGLMTPYLAERFAHLTVVDGSARFCADLRARFRHARVVCSLFEDYAPEDRFDAIVLGHVLEHVEAPRALLARAREWLAPEGRLFAAVPNARSLHRQAAVLMGLLGREDELNEADLRHGHRRVYDPESFRQDVLGAGLRIEVFGGYWLKPVSNGQIERDWTPEMLEAFMALGERYPDIAGELYIVATR